MEWIKLGKIFSFENHSDDAVSHSMTASAMHLEGDRYRFYMNPRSKDGASRPHFIEVDMKDPFTILKVSEKSVIERGLTGGFDELGMVFTSYVTMGDELWFYYAGFPRTAKTIFFAHVGLAASTDGGLTFKKKYPGPVKSVSKNEAYFSTGPRVYKIREDFFVLYYTSCDAWEEKDGKLKHFYNIKRATSTNGVDWSEGTPAIDFKNEHEYAISIPSLIIEDGIWKMWYSYRAQEVIQTYRIGYAESKDGIAWERKDELMDHFDVSKSGWDSEMVAYPYVFDHKGERYMLYNGNGYGTSGVGLAKLKK